MTRSQLKRARAPEDKTERRGAIVQAAADLLRRDPSAGFSVDELARRAGLAKGTVYLYFGTREEVLLALHAQKSGELFDVVERALAAADRHGERVVADGLAYLREHPEFFPVAGNCRYMLDTNVGTAAALAFKLGLAQRLEVIGRRIEEIYAGLARGEGVALLTNCYALIIGLWQQADPPLCLRKEMHRADMAIFRIDFEKQLAAALLDLWEGAQRRSRKAAS